ncbi:MAG: hypothetical protein H8E26_07450 [FCB group bacterium]|nr:hypothetical protein [FCB group bacterium]MBL7029075.1 hypothetical protein [Candidatus Neomarinimicrobiota bacterium]MBL7122555.1 hypothetical protein [Candidatus Neomarinimicrobiota bacterium]
MESLNNNMASRVGLWASAYAATLGIIYIFVLVIYTFAKGFTIPPGPFVQLTAGIITFLVAPGLVVLFTAIRYVNEKDNKILGSLGVSFSILYAVTVCINRFVQLTVIQQSLPDIPADLIRFLPYGDGSIMLALEVLGWGFFSSLAFLFVAPLFSNSPLNKAIRYLCVLYAILSFGSVISFATNIFIPTGPIAWGPILLALSILLFIHFRDLNRQLP